MYVCMRKHQQRNDYQQKKIHSASQIEILDEAVCISLPADAFWKRMYPSLPHCPARWNKVKSKVGDLSRG